MRSGANRDFASMLDELIAASTGEQGDAARPSVSLDYLSVAEELHSGRIRVSPDAAAAEYREAAATADALFAAAEAAKAREEALPSVDPEAIWNELRLGEIKAVADLSKRRRAFAFKNHPDRVAPHLRQRAMVRMQVANMLIDEAERKVGGKKR